MKHLLTTSALGLILAVSPAAAQDQKPAEQPAQQMQPQPGSPATPGAGPGALQAPDAAQKKDMQKPETQTGQTEADKPDAGKKAQAGAGGLNFVQEQDAGTHLARDLIGASVTNANDESIGEVRNLIFDEDGKITAVVIGAGGFLGIGGKSVAVEFEGLQISKDENNNMELTLNTTRDALDSAPDFVSLKQKQAEQERAARQSSPPAGGSPIGGGAGSPRTQ